MSKNQEEEQLKAFNLLKKLDYDKYMRTPCYLDKKDNKYWFKYMPNNDGNWLSFSIEIEKEKIIFLDQQKITLHSSAGISTSMCRSSEPDTNNTCLDIPKKYSIEIYKDGVCVVNDSELSHISTWINFGGPTAEALLIALDLLNANRYSYIGGYVDLNTNTMIISWSEK